MNSKIVDPLVKQRRAIQSRLKTVSSKVKNNSIKPLDEHDCQVHVENVKGMVKEFLDLQKLIVNECITDADIEVQLGVTQTFEDDSSDCLSALSRIQRATSSPKPSTSNSSLNQGSASSAITKVRLPAIELPSFNGNFEQWISFKDLFQATVGSNSSLSGAQKLQYLKSAVKGDASSLIQSYQVTDDNYNEAWESLMERYDIKKDIVNAILKRLLNQSNLHKESVTGLQGLVDTTSECIRSLEVQGMPVQHWQEILAFIICEKLDPETRRHWTLTQTGVDPSKLAELLEFLKLHIRGLMSSSSSSKLHSHSSSKAGSSSQRQVSTHHSSTSDKCAICKGNHAIYICQKFKALTAAERNSAAQRSNLCFRCLKSGHGRRDCKSSHKCKHCNGTHSSFLHQEKASTSTTEKKSEASTFSSSLSNNTDDSQILLSTAMCNVIDQAGQERIVRVFIDGGSQATLITEQCAKALGLERERCSVKISGVSSCPIADVRSKVSLTLHSRISKDKMDIQAFVLPKVTGIMPTFPCQQDWDHLKGLNLADPNYFKPRKIDILLGADNNQCLIKDGVKKGSKLAPVATNTIFGWILSGKIQSEPQQKIQIHHIEIDNILKRFWEVEEFPDKKHLSEEEKKCEDNFHQTHTRQSDGRYIVSLPLKPNIKNLGSSKEVAVRRFHSVERRLALKPEIKSQYMDFMNEYLQLNHMEKVQEDSMPTTTYYLPHHFVLKEDSSTTKLRVVFDGSCRSTSGLSLNDCQMVGPTVQEDLFSILVRFRCHLIALKADIGKMYRQFKVNPAHCDLQRILWRESTDQPLQQFRLTTVTYGTASASYLATRSLNQLAIDESVSFPAASKVLLRDAYVDDIMSGAATPEEAYQLFEELCQLLKSGGMELRKWSCSDPLVLQKIPADLRENQKALTFDTDATVKALGIKWSPLEDNFIFSVNIPIDTVPITKRSLLSDLAKVFDPLGWLSPTTIQAKIIFQDLWKQTKDWDDQLNDETIDKWVSYSEGLKYFEYLSIPRALFTGRALSQQLHGFSDSSEKAYAAAVYLRTVQDDGLIVVRLVTAKTKVAPIKSLSIPRLELCGALMLARLMASVKKAMKLDCQWEAWTDSTTVLKWLSSFPGRWNTFVANRVSEIQDIIPVEYWHHVKSEENPADCASRGIPASELKDFSLWWAGPAWLKTETYPVHQQDIDLQLVQHEEKKKSLKVHHQHLALSLLTRFSSLITLQRVTAFMFRFVHNFKNKKSRILGNLTSDELRKGLQYWIKVSQHEVYAKEIEDLKDNHAIKVSSKILQLNPFIDKMGLLRVGGRLENSALSENQKHQMILPPHHIITKLIINYHHKNKLHAGFQLLWSTLQQTYWIPRARDVIRQEIRKCVVCRRHRAAVAEQLMGSLPSPRVNPGHPFQKSGVDYAGPFQTRLMKVTKAVHLEAVGDLSADSFIAAFKRFSSRRGVPTDLYSDCGTNFVGADKELRSLLMQSQMTIENFHAERGTRWHFNSPAAPHHGGLWEAAVKSTKYHLRRVIGTPTLTFEEFTTILTQIEGQLNSRPLCPMSSDPLDYTALTPGHFLIGHPITAVPEPDLTSIKMNRLSRWQLTQQICQHFWRRWTSEYLTSLQQRHKWKAASRNFVVGDLVLVKDENLPPAKWKLGRVSVAHPGADGLVRVVTIKTADGEFKRPVVKLCLLLSTEEQ